MALHDADLEFIILVQNERVTHSGLLQILHLESRLGEGGLQTLRGLSLGRQPFF